jgi:hypothetical protein
MAAELVSHRIDFFVRRQFGGASSESGYEH